MIMKVSTLKESTKGKTEVNCHRERTKVIGVLHCDGSGYMAL